jgi:hypothetical protein
MLDSSNKGDGCFKWQTDGSFETSKLKECHQKVFFTYHCENSVEALGYGEVVDFIC